MIVTSSALKIVHLDSGEDLRGGQGQMLLLARELRARGHDQRIVCPEGSQVESRSGTQGFTVVSLPAHDPWHAHGIVQLRQQLELQPTDILHAHDGKGHTIGWFASLGRPVKRIASRRVTFLPSRRLDYRIKYGRTCDGVIAVSEFIQGLVIGSGVSAAKVAMIPDGIEVPGVLPDAETRRAARARWNFRDDDFVIGQLGAFAPEKGQALAVEALLELEEKLPRAKLFLVGDGPLLADPHFKTLLSKAGARVRHARHIENLWDYFPALDLYVMPSLSEGLGSSVLHAMAHGVPVVASRVGGLPEIVEENKTGWLVEPNSPKELAKTILEAHAAPERWREFAVRGREVAEGFSSKIMAERTEAFYLRVMSGRTT